MNVEIALIIVMTLFRKSKTIEERKKRTADSEYLNLIRANSRVIVIE